MRTLLALLRVAPLLAALFLPLSGTAAEVTPAASAVPCTEVPAVLASRSSDAGPRKAPQARGPLLPQNRIVAFYGNFRSRQMGILGRLDEAELRAQIAGVTALWAKADPKTPVIPAVHYVAMVAQADPGAGGLYRAAMPKDQVCRAVTLARSLGGITFLDLQVGLAPLATEVRRFGPYLANADVHLGLDPEFAMAASGRPPGKVIGTLDAEQVNEVIAWLSEIVRANRLPPKVLVLHRFTSKMLTNARDIRPTPEVQVVVNMDGWGPPQLKLDTYRQIVAPEAVQFTGFKIFYIQDMLPPSTALVDPATILALKPVPAYIQYQ